MSPRSLICAYGMSLLLGAILLLPGGAIAQPAKDYPTARRVYKHLAQAFSDGRPPPELRLIPAAQRPQLVATYIPTGVPRIELSDKALQLCLEMGADSTSALAAILAHELAHYYRGHNWCVSFASAHTHEELNMMISPISKEEKFRLEVEADYYGGVYSRIAGYRTQPLFPQLIEHIYQSFQLPDTPHGYPSKKGRNEIYEAAASKMKEWNFVFETAEVLVALEHFEEAALCYQRVLQEFPSREVFNNLGSVQLAQAMSLFSRAEFPYALPLELDQRSRLLYGETRSAQNVAAARKEAMRKSQLEAARESFSKALFKESTYHPALLNLATTHLLLNDAYSAIGQANRLLELEPTSAQGLWLRGLGFHLLDEKQKAIKDLEAAAASGLLLAQANLDLIREGKDEGRQAEKFWTEYYKAQASPKRLIPEKDLIDEQRPEHIDLNTLLPISISQEPFLELRHDPCNRYQVKGQGLELRFISTLPEYPMATQTGLFLGSSKEQVSRDYGSPDYSLSLTGGSLWVYRKQRILFHFEEGKGLVKWILYAISSRP